MMNRNFMQVVITLVVVAVIASIIQHMKKDKTFLHLYPDKINVDEIGDEPFLNKDK